MHKTILFSILLAGVGNLAMAAEPRTAHTYQLADGEERPAVSLEVASWLAGSWTGNAFGQQFEAVWNPPSAGSMIGLFKLIGDDGVSFYEILMISVDEGTLSLKVKHFNADFTAWEDKADFVDFRLVKAEENALHFGGISFYRDGDDAMDGYIVMRNGEELTEHHLKYTRRSPDD
ncbi:MAG: hypothetical protein HKN35_02365 [Woeseia sp.]|nr:hypothetical protein [Woeseia sp.]MBT8096343.1 hypothetical protein [Woeseia sp.]NNE59719.1 hypothetical protein [Woeseia sp.]NNL55823.1 hypothetical protein [Woeseia sp.]